MTVLRLPFFPFCPERIQARELAEECRAYGTAGYDDLWNCWHGQLYALRLESLAAQGVGVSSVSRYAPEPKGWGVLCLWLDERVEHAVDGLWEGSPSRAYGAHLLALELCMAALRILLPEAAAHALPPGREFCAPLAVPDAGQRRELLKSGLLAGNPETGKTPPVLLRRYAVLTWMPFRGGCAACALRRTCPRVCV